ncbi:DUF262 domain-containing protein [Corynebacterium pilbarense]
MNVNIEILDQQLQTKRREISTEKLSMSLGEISSLYGKGDLIIRPSFQRLFRWSQEQRTRLIESFLLRIPIPPIFVSSDEDGKWEVIDGLQRISTVLQLQGLLQEEPPLVLGGTKYLPALEGVSWNDLNGHEFSDSQKRDLLRSRIDVTIIERGSDPEAKFDLFQRLNSLGSSLSGQEIRNAILQSINPDVAEWVNRLAITTAFSHTVKVNKKEEQRAYREELVLRFLALHDGDVGDLSSSGYLTTLLDDFAVDLCGFDDDRLDELERTFNATFQYFAEAGDENIFKIERSGAVVDRLSVTAFEILALGVGNWYAHNSRKPKLTAQEFLQKTKSELDVSSSGKSAEQRMKLTIPRGRELAEELL